MPRNILPYRIANSSSVSSWWTMPRSSPSSGCGFALHVLARDQVGRRDDVVALGGGGDDGARDVVVRPVDRAGSPSSSSGTGSGRGPSCRWRGTDP